jgi:hypothetical protein
MEHLMLIAASLILATQIGNSQQQGADVSVLSTRVEVVADYAADARAGRTAARATSLPVDQWESGAAFDRLDAVNDRSMGKKYRVALVVRNDGPRAIRAVTCVYPLGYPHGRRPPGRLRFKVRQGIGPGETLRLAHSFITSQHVALRSGASATIERIEYKDGSVWRRR